MNAIQAPLHLFWDGDRELPGTCRVAGLVYLISDQNRKLGGSAVDFGESLWAGIRPGLGVALPIGIDHTYAETIATVDTGGKCVTNVATRSDFRGNPHRFRHQPGAAIVIGGPELHRVDLGEV